MKQLGQCALAIFTTRTNRATRTGLLSACSISFALLVVYTTCIVVLFKFTQIQC